MNSSQPVVRWQLEVRGIVQGVGFRPFVYSLACRLGLSGFVLNHSSGVRIEIQGPEAALEEFCRRLAEQPPPAARIESVQRRPVAVVAEEGFRIIASQSAEQESTPISPDLATCEDCLREFATPGDRRYHYPFINCTNCGPRYTIVRDIPYDRPQTTMAVFRMCPECQREYDNPADRRYHAQPNACPRCGPQVWFVGRGEDEERFSRPGANSPRGEAAFGCCHRYLDQEKIVAVKGIGGFHLAALASSDRALELLRRRKGRVDKPFALMVPDLETAARLVHLGPDEVRLLTSPARPIVLLPRRKDAPVSDLVAPGNRFLGIMLPYSALHVLLLDGRVLVMTSGNRSEEPIARTNQEARERLAPLADAFLLHDREIFVVCDDSVTRVFVGAELPVRRSRGYAPMPVLLKSCGPSVLATGGELKATFCITKENRVYLSPHVGDMGNLETLRAFERAVEHFLRLFRVQPELVVCDLHPGYLSTRWATQWARQHDVPLLQVQHHHAHIAGVLLEHGWPREQRVLGVSFDGTGYGPDGAIWGGEFLVCDWSQYRRVAQLKYVPLPGGDAAIARPYRVALSWLWAAGVDWHPELPPVRACPPAERNVLRQQLERNLHCVPTSSMGRLFDAAAALAGVRQQISYEAQAAMELEACSLPPEQMPPYRFVLLTESEPWQVDPRPMWHQLAAEVLAGVGVERLAARIHRTVAEMILRVCQELRTRERLETVALSGGVFQNVVLLRYVLARLQEAGWNVLLPRQVPPNDGGLALGQAAVALGRLANDTAG